jgi:hypothetical protein
MHSRAPRAPLAPVVSAHRQPIDLVLGRAVDDAGRVVVLNGVQRAIVRRLDARIARAAKQHRRRNVARAAAVARARDRGAVGLRVVARRVVGLELRHVHVVALQAHARVGRRHAAPAADERTHAPHHRRRQSLRFAPRGALDRRALAVALLLLLGALAVQSLEPLDVGGARHGERRQLRVQQRLQLAGALQRLEERLVAALPKGSDGGAVRRPARAASPRRCRVGVGCGALFERDGKAKQLIGLEVVAAHAVQKERIVANRVGAGRRRLNGALVERVGKVVVVAHVLQKHGKIGEYARIRRLDRERTRVQHLGGVVVLHLELDKERKVSAGCRRAPDWRAAAGETSSRPPRCARRPAAAGWRASPARRRAARCAPRHLSSSRSTLAGAPGSFSARTARK